MMAYAFVLFIILSQALSFSTCGILNMELLFLSLALSGAVLSFCYLYFHSQQKIIDDAASKINCFTLGGRDMRIDSDYEGELYKLFHEVNKLATVLDSQAVREESAKDFLKDTISDISHQLKTPLAALNIYNELLRDESGDKAAVCKFAAKSENEIKRIEILVHSLLKITRLDAGIIVMEKQAENLSDIMLDIQSRFETQAAQEQKVILFSGPDDVSFDCDREWLLEAISNIVKNALDHISINGEIQISWNKLPGSIQIIIKDNGRGIHPEDLHHIFKRFYRSRFSKGKQGIGLGLPLAKSIVEAHGGGIAVDSILGAGSTFSISFFNLTKI
jgi:signal transduction histidine kinase